MTAQPDQPEQEQQAQQAGEEPEVEPPTGDPDFPVPPDFSGFYRGAVGPGGIGGIDENYLMRTRLRAIRSWGQEGTGRRAKGFCIFLIVVGGVLTTLMLLGT